MSEGEQGRYGRSTVRVGDPLPAVLRLKQLADVLGISVCQARRQELKGHYQHLAITPNDGKSIFSGKKVQAWIDGTNAVSRFFSSARRA